MAFSLSASVMEIVNACRAVVVPHQVCVQKSGKDEVTKRRVSDKVEDANENTINKFYSEFSAEDFVENLLKEGSKVPCDETSESFNNTLNLPPFYNEKMFKAGQQFFHRNMFGLFLSKFLGLVTLLTINSVKILVMTNMSSTMMSAYRRYLSTIFHMCLWYDKDFKPGTSSWNSLIKVRSMHNSASKRSCSYLRYRISQKDMALTQFGFMGLVLVRSKMVGVHQASEEELKGFIHLWRTVGCILGIEERFNICRESLRETKEICNLIIEKVFRPALNRPVDEFDSMSRALINGMWAMNPFLEYEVFLLYLRMTLDNDTNTSRQPSFKELSLKGRMKLYFIFYTIWCLQFSITRTIHNYLQVLTLWLMEHFPFLAYYNFGKGNAHVSI